MSNLKATFSTNNYLENAAVNDQKPYFLRTVAEWVKAWQTEKKNSLVHFNFVTFGMFC